GGLSPGSRPPRARDGAHAGPLQEIPPPVGRSSSRRFSMHAQAFKVGMGSPDDVSQAAKLLDQGTFAAEHVAAVLGKTEGNGGVNDFTRALATLSFQLLQAKR